MIHLIRHGETEWSRDRRHTGRTDLPLTEQGRLQAAQLRSVVERLAPDRVLSSPLLRAGETAALTGLGDRVRIDDRLREWDYGSAEGRTTEEMQQAEPGWTVWTHPIEGGESLAQVVERVDALVVDLADELAAGTGEILLFGHAHLFRILAARWCDLPPEAGARFTLDPASLSTLGYERSNRCVIRWNLGAST